MSDGDRPVRRLRRKTRAPAGVAVLAERLPRRCPLAPAMSSGIACRGPGSDTCDMFQSFAGTDVVATVASFCSIQAFGRLLCLAMHFCGGQGLWDGLLARVSRSVFALSVTSARASISRMKTSSYGIWPGVARGSYVRLSDYRWCLDLFYCESQIFSAVIPVRAASNGHDGDFDSFFQDGFPCGERIANLLPANQLPPRARELVRDAQDTAADPVPRTGGWACAPRLFRQFRQGRMTCSLWFCDLASRDVVAGIFRDAWRSWQRSCVRFFVAERFEPVHVCEASSDDGGPSSAGTLYRSGRVLEIWVPFECSYDAEGNHDLSCSIEIFVADGSDHPEDPPRKWERQRAGTNDLLSALSGCTLRSAFPCVDVGLRV